MRTCCLTFRPAAVLLAMHLTYGCDPGWWFRSFQLGMREVLDTIKYSHQPGFCCAGSPLSIHPNVTRHRGRTAASSLMTPAMQAAAPAGSSMLGCITLIKKQGAATGVAAATGRSKRSRAAVAAVADEQAAAGGDGGAAMMVTTDGKESAPCAEGKKVVAQLSTKGSSLFNSMSRHRQRQATVKQCKARRNQSAHNLYDVMNP